MDHEIKYRDIQLDAGVQTLQGSVLELPHQALSATALQPQINILRCHILLRHLGYKDKDPDIQLESIAQILQGSVLDLPRQARSTPALQPQIKASYPFVRSGP